MILRRIDILAAAILGIAAVILGSNRVLAADQPAHPAASASQPFEVPSVVPPPAETARAVETTLVGSRRAGLPEVGESWRIEVPANEGAWGNDPWFRPGNAPERADVAPVFSLPELDEVRPAIVFETPAVALPDTCRRARAGRCVFR